MAEIESFAKIIIIIFDRWPLISYTPTNVCDSRSLALEANDLILELSVKDFVIYLFVCRFVYIYILESINVFMNMTDIYKRMKQQ